MSPKAGTAPAFGRSGSHCSPTAPGEGSVVAVPGRTCPQQSGVGRCLQSAPVGHSRLALDSCAPRHRTMQPGEALL